MHKLVVSIICVSGLFFSFPSSAQTIAPKPVVGETGETTDPTHDEFSIEYERYRVFRKRGPILAGLSGGLLGVAVLLTSLSGYYNAQPGVFCNTDECREEDERTDEIAKGLGIAALSSGVVGVVGLILGLGFRTYGKKGMTKIEQKRRALLMIKAGHHFRPRFVSVGPVVTSDLFGGLISFSF